MIVNRYWYYCFVLIGAAILLYTMYKKRNVGDVIAFFLASVTFCFIGELVALFMFQGYMYKPEIFADPFANNVIGHVIPNASLWGTTAVLVGALHMRYRGIAIISLLFMLTEIVFLKLNLYEHRWWRLYMTGIASVAYLTTVKLVYSKLERNKTGALRFILFAMLGIVVLHSPSIVFLLLNMQFFHLGLLDNPYRESILVGVLYHAVNSFIIVWSAYCLRLRYRILVSLAIIFLLDGLMYLTNIMHVSNGLHLWGVLTASAVSTAAIIGFEQYTWKSKAVS